MIASIDTKLGPFIGSNVLPRKPLTRSVQTQLWEVTNDLLLVQNDLAALGLRTNDDTDSEQNIMKAHGDYLQSLTEVGSIVCHGPVDDPEGGWGLSIFSAKDQTEAERLTAADPIILDDVCEL